MKEQTGIDVPRPLSNDRYHYISKVDRSFRGVCRQKNIFILYIFKQFDIAGYRVIRPVSELSEHTL